MKPAPFIYHDPRRVEDIVDLLGRLENARVLAGGQSLVPMLNFRYVAPDHLIDLNKVDELSFIKINGPQIEFGAMTRQREIEFSDAVSASCPILLEALEQVGHRQTRNRGTIGGSICHFDPSAELANLAILHSALLHLRSASGERSTAMQDFAQGFMTTDVREGEILTAIDFPLWSKGHGYAFEEFARRRGDFALCAVSALLESSPAGAITRAAIAVSGLGPVPVRLTAAENMLKGQTCSHEVFRACAAEAQKIEAMDDSHVSGAYRQHLARVLTYRALERAAKRAQGASHV